MKVRTTLARNHGTTRRKGRAPHEVQRLLKDAQRAMSDTQREVEIKKPLARFIRNRALPDEVENLRYRLIQARVMQGMLATEAAEKFGYANSAQISKMESGVNKTPTDGLFLKKAAEVYSVSVDWLLGLSHNAEPDAKTAHQYALLRGTEGMVNTAIAQITTAMIRTATETQPVAEELERMLSAVDSVTERFEKFCALPEFEDMRGGASVVIAVERLTEGVAPLRAKLKKLKGMEMYMAEVRAGTLTPIPYLMDRFIGGGFDPK